MTVAFNLPEIGEGVVEGEIVEWHVAVGDEVAHDQNLISVLTDKATIEIAATFGGVITELKGEPGDVIEVGAVLLVYHAGGETPAPAPEAPKSNSQAPAAVESAVKQDHGGGSVLDFALPEIGEGVMEGEIVEWLVAVGDSVQADQALISVLTDKATIEIPAPATGTVTEVLGEPGDIIDVGQVILKLRAKGGPAVVATSSAPPVSETPVVAETVAAVHTATSSRAVAPADNPSISAFGTPLATPAVRRFASSKGVDLRTVRGTGPNHRITRADVDGFLAAGDPAAGAPPASVSAAAPVAKPAAPKPAGAPVGEECRERIHGLRKAIYNSMSRSKSIIPHFTYVDEVDMEALVTLRSELKAVAAEQDVKLTYLPFIAKAVTFALKKFPIMNASVDDEAGEIVFKGYYNIGIATATPSGLTVPVLKNADQKNVLSMATEIEGLTTRARNKRSTLDDISGGTFTITSLGRLGGMFATPIINHPEVGILGIHNLEERAVVHNGQIVARKRMNISLSFDHRVVDGDVGATFAQEVKSYLENPGRLLLQMI